MRNPDRIEPFLAEVAKHWHKVPDWRFGQFISNVLCYYGRDPFFMEEDQFVSLLEEYFKEFD